MELHELQYNILIQVYLLKSKLGEADRELFCWMMPMVKKYRGINPSDSFISLVNEGIKLEGEEPFAFERRLRSAGTKAPTLKKYPTPFLDSKIAQLGGYGSKFQNTLLEIHSCLSIMDEDID